MQIYTYKLVPKSAPIWHTDPIIQHRLLLRKCIGSNKRNVPNKRTVSSNWNTRVNLPTFSRFTGEKLLAFDTLLMPKSSLHIFKSDISWNRITGCCFDAVLWSGCVKRHCCHPNMLNCSMPHSPITINVKFESNSYLFESEDFWVDQQKRWLPRLRWFQGEFQR